MEIFIERCPFDIERLEREVNILVVSDLHYHIDETNPAKPPDGKEINSILVKSIASAGEDWQPDIVIIAGDLVNKCEPRNYEHFFHLTKELVDRYPNLRNTIFCTPGNHDVTRPKGGNQSILDLIEKLRKGKEKYVFGLSDTVKKFYVAARNSIVSDQDSLETLAQIEKAYFETYLEKQEQLRHQDYIVPFEVNHPVDGIKTVYTASVLGVQLACHNSSFFCDLAKPEKDRNNLFLILDLVKAVLASLPQTGPVISFMHHPYFFLNESEFISPIVTKDEDNEEYNCFSRILKSSDLVISGHVHGDLQDPTFLQHHAYLVTNGTSYTQDSLDDMCYPFTYAILKVNKQRNWFAMKKFIYNNDLKTYKTDEHAENTHYSFVKRNKGDSTDLQTEKLRVLDYIANLEQSPDPEGHKLIHSFVHQLGLYEDYYRFSSSEPGARKFIYDAEIRNTARTILLTDPNGNNRIRVFIIDGIKPYHSIVAQLKWLEHNAEPATRVYFTVSRNHFINDGIVATVIIRKFCKDYRNNIFCSKISNVGIDILFH